MGRGRGLERGWTPSPENLLLFHPRMGHFRAVFKLDLTEETRTQLQEEEAVASSCPHTGYAYTHCCNVTVKIF